MSAADYRSWLAAQGQTVLIIPPAEETVPDWQTSEKAFMAKIVQRATEGSWLSYHTHKSANSAAGFPDLVLMRRGRLEVAELKVGNNKPTKQQCQWLDEFSKLSANARQFGFDQIGAHLWYPDDWSEIVRVLR